MALLSPYASLILCLLFHISQLTLRHFVHSSSRSRRDISLVYPIFAEDPGNALPLPLSNIHSLIIICMTWGTLLNVSQPNELGKLGSSIRLSDIVGMNKPLSSSGIDFFIHQTDILFSSNVAQFDVVRTRVPCQSVSTFLCHAYMYTHVTEHISGGLCVSSCCNPTWKMSCLMIGS